MISSRRILLELVSAIVVFYAGYREYPRRHHQLNHAEVRTKAIVSQARQRSQTKWIIAGDSLVELADFEEMCGGSALNAGVGGAELRDVEPLLKRILDEVQATNVIVAVGVNNATRANPTAIVEFERQYLELIKGLIGRGIKVSISTISPVAHDFPNGDVNFDTRLIVAMNEEIRRISAKTGVRLIDYSQLEGTDGFLPAKETDDGVHLSPHGYTHWRAAIDAAVCP